MGQALGCVGQHLQCPDSAGPNARARCFGPTLSHGLSGKVHHMGNAHQALYIQLTALGIPPMCLHPDSRNGLDALRPSCEDANRTVGMPSVQLGNEGLSYESCGPRNQNGFGFRQCVVLRWYNRLSGLRFNSLLQNEDIWLNYIL